MGEHTQTPWCVGPPDVIWRTFVDEQGRRNHRPVAQCCEVTGPYIKGENEANAAFIVHAVNCHDDLVEALFRLKTECEIEKLDQRAGFDAWVAFANKVLARAQSPIP